VKTPMIDSKLYPLKYDKKIAWLQNLKNLDFGLEQTMPTIDQLEILTGAGKSGDAGLIQSGILDSLNITVNRIEKDYDKAIYPEWTDDIVLNNKIREGIKEYYEIRIYAQATQICDHLDGLIQLDRYPKEMFGQYKTLRKLIQKVTDDSEKIRALMQLKIIAKSIIPPQIKYEKVEVIEPSIGGGSVQEGF